MSYTLSISVTTPFQETIDNVTASLKEIGFGILTEIDLTATLKEKIGEDIKPYRILGACNPRFAFEALKLEEDIGTLLPCNVIVKDEGDGTCTVSMIDPVAMVAPTGNPNLVPFATEVRAMLQESLKSLRV